MSNIIQIWIDLWTTNSAICINIDGKYTIIKNSDQMEYTPSVFWYNKGGNKVIWLKAFDQLFKFCSDETINNYKSEIKRLMGTNEIVNFTGAWSYLSPEQISSEIVLYLKESVLKKYPKFETGGVVITIPAYFDTIQKEATKKAWELAWFSFVVLLQEPIAAAIAYGYDNQVNENRLVYDLWWGTFDVAIISSKDGVLTVKGHAWDNYLWWKDFDNLIVDHILVPTLQQNFSFEDLNRNNNEMKMYYNHLKWIAESSKKELTDSDTTKINIEDIKDNVWNDVYIEIEITRNDFEKLIEPLIDKSIELCKNALHESWFHSQDIAKIILVGWSTLTPYIRKKLEAEMQIFVDSSVDPLTVVAKGACIYGGSQVISSDQSSQSKKLWSVDLKLHYEPMTSEQDITITGIIETLSHTTHEHYIQIQSEDGNYSSSKIKLKSGKFFDTVSVSPGKTNNYFIYLTDDSWSIIATNPESFSIVHWLSIAGTPLSHSVSIALNKKTFMWEQTDEYCEVIFERSTILPLKKTLTYRTSRDLKKWDSQNALPIRIYEWESKRPDRNQLICEVTLLWTEIPYNLPEGTEVNITLEMTNSWEMNVEVYFPSIDLHKKWDKLRTSGDQEIYDTISMKTELEKENERTDEIAEHIPSTELQSIKQQINTLYKQSESNDPDTLRKTHHQIKELKSKIDNQEKDSFADKIINEFHKEIEKSDELFTIDEFPLEYKQTQTLKEEWNKAIRAKDREKLESINDKISGLRISNILNTPEWMKYRLWMLYERRHESTDPIKTNHIFNTCSQYVENNNIEGMRSCINELMKLLPKDSQENMAKISWITRN